MCIKENFYTCGDNRDYEDLLFFVETHNPTVNHMNAAAQNIYDHSDVDKFMERFGEDEEHVYSFIMHCIEETILTVFDVIELE